MLNLPFEPSQVAGAAGPLVSVVLGTDGRPVAARDTRMAMSLGWLVKAFLKHHPEIRFGVFPATALRSSTPGGRAAPHAMACLAARTARR